MEEALRAKEKAERLYEERNLVGAKRYALKAQALCPGLEGVSQMVTTFNVYLASEARVNGEIDYYSILGLKPTADDNKVKKQYKKMAVLLHPDKNKCIGADGAFRLVSEAWSLLSDRVKRSAYDMRRNKQLLSQTSLTNLSSDHGNGVSHFDHSYVPPPVPHHRLDTFWTVCTSCKVQYEYLRKYLNKKLSCKNCRGVFLAVETGVAPVNGSYPFHTSWSPMPPTNGYASNGVNGVSYYPSNSVLYTGNGVHLGHGSDYSSNMSFHWSSGSKSSHAVVIPNGFSTISTDTVYKTNCKVKVKSKEKRKLTEMDASSMKTTSVQFAANSATVYRNPLLTKTGKIDKRRRVDTIAYVKSLFEDTGSNASAPCDAKPPNATVNHMSEASISNEPKVRRYPVALPPQLDIRKMLIDKAKTQITKKLDEMRLAAAAATVAAAAAAAAKKNMAQLSENIKPLELDTKSEPISISVPDPDFHDFDKDRTEECFQAKQIWALYDEEDGMPRLYCMIRQVISLDPFKMHITYLNSRTSSEFGSVDWVGAGFTKSCGKFKAMHSDVVDQVNIFSHVLSQEIKAGRGGCVRIYPKTGDIWAIYRNWSPDWDSSTPDEVRRQYDMVEVLSNYNEGVSICPLVKLEGYNTVYRKSDDSNAIRRVPKQEMFRFSHQVPSWLLEGVVACGLRDGCWDLDPAATPDDLLHSAKQPHATDKPKPNLVPKVQGLRHVVEQAMVGCESNTEPASEDIHLANTQVEQEVNRQTAVEKRNPYAKVKQDQSHDTNERAASEPLQNLDVKLHESSFEDESVSVQRIEVQCSPEHAKNGAELNSDLDQNNQLHYLDEHVSVEPKIDLEVNPNGQAAVKGIRSYLGVNLNQFQFPPRHPIAESYVNPEVMLNQYYCTNDHADLAPGPYPTVEPGQHHAGNQHGRVDEPKLVSKQDNLHWALQPTADEEQPQLSEAEQIELLFRF